MNDKVEEDKCGDDYNDDDYDADDRETYQGQIQVVHCQGQHPGPTALSPFHQIIIHLMIILPLLIINPPLISIMILTILRSSS